MNKPPKKSRQLSTYVDADTVAKFKTAAKEKGHTDSSLLRHIIEQYLQSLKEKE